MSKPKFKVGDVVRVRTTSKAERAHKLVPDFVPAPGTVGGIEEIESDLSGGWIRWTGGHGCHADRTWVPFDYVEPVIEAITIYRSGRSVYAKDLSTGRIEKARCSPEDEFDFHKGAALAFDRLLGCEAPKPEEPKPEEPKPEEPKYFTGKVVCVKTGFGMCGDVRVTWWTVGKTYDVVDGVIRDNDGDTRRPALSLEELNKITKDYAEFVALVE